MGLVNSMDPTTKSRKEEGEKTGRKKGKKYARVFL